MLRLRDPRQRQSRRERVTCGGSWVSWAHINVYTGRPYDFKGTVIGFRPVARRKDEVR